MSFYQLPNPWNPGYVIPDYVMAEPPERGTFTTQWLPRGTISELVPDFLARPGKRLLGRNDAGLGSLSGCSISGSSLSHDSLGASSSEYPSPGGAGPKLAAYGQQVAASLMAVARRYPKSQRAQVMKTAMNRLDPNLFTRAKANADALAKKGMSAKAALQHGIAIGVVQGLGSELGKLGSRRPPQSSSLSGLGRTRGESALGAISTALRGSIAGGGQVTSGSSATPTGVTGNPPRGFTWNHDHWELCGPGCVPVASPWGGATIDTHTGRVTPIPGSWSADKLIGVGPFMFKADGVSCLRIRGNYSTATSECNDMSLDQFDQTMRQFVLKMLSTDCSFNAKAAVGSAVTSLVSLPVGVMGFIGSKPCVTSSMVDAGPSTKWGNMRQFLPALPPRINHDYLTLVGEDDGYGDVKDPIVVAKHPITGEDYGVFMAMQAYHPDQPWGTSTNPVDLVFTWRPLPSNWASDAIAWVLHLAAEIVDLVGEVVEGIVDATCSLLTAPGMTQALLAGAAQSKSGTALGVAVGAAVGAAACGGTKPVQPTCPPGGVWNPVMGTCQPLAPPFNWTPILLAGGGLLVVLVMRSQS